MNLKTIVLALAAAGCAASAPAQFGADTPMHGKKAQGAIVVRDGARVYDKKDSLEVKHTLKRGDAVVGWHREAIVTVYEFEEDHGRVRVLFPNPGSAIPYGGWMSPEDLAPFTYDCGCETNCIPWKASFGPSKFNLCFQEARDAKLGRLEEARADYLKTLALNPKSQDAVEALRQLPPPAASTTAGGPAPPAGTTPAQAPPPSTVAVAYYAQGVALHDQGKFAEAIAAFDQAIRVDPGYADAYRRRGNSKHRLGDQNGSLADQNRAIELDPANARAWLGRGNVYYILRQWDVALASYEKAVALDPGYSSNYYGRGNVYYYTNRLEAALADYNRALELAGEKVTDSMYLQRGYTLAKLGRTEEARADYQNALALNPHNPDPAQAMKNLPAPAQSVAGGSQPPSAAPRPATSADSGTNLPGTPALPASPAVSAATSPEAGTTPAPPTLKLELFDDDKWPHHDSSPWAHPRNPSPPPSAFSIAAAEIAPVYELAHMTPADYDDLITAAMAGMRLVMGPVTAEQDRLFEAKWAPLFEYPCQEVLDYLAKFNPLCGRFLTARTALEDSAKAYDRAQADLLGAAAEDDADGVFAASEAMRAHKNAILASSNAMTAAAKGIHDLGDLPNPLARKKAARKLDDQALQMLTGEFRIEPAESTVKPGAKVAFSFVVPPWLKCDRVKLGALWYDPADSVEQSFVASGSFVVEAVPWFKMKPVPGIKAFAVVRVTSPLDFAGKLEDCDLGGFDLSFPASGTTRYEDGRGKRLVEAWATSRGARFGSWSEADGTITWNSTQFSFTTRTEEGGERVTRSFSGRVAADGTAILSFKVETRREFKTQAPDSMPGLETETYIIENIPLTRVDRGGALTYLLTPEQVLTNLKTAEWTRQDYRPYINPDDPHPDCRYRTETIKEVLRNNPSARAEFQMLFKLNYDKEHSFPPRWSDIPTNFVVGSADPATNLPPEVAAALARAREEAANKAKAEKDLEAREKAARITYHEANIAHFEQLAAALRGDLGAAKGDVAREDLHWQIMVAQSNIQREKDAIQMVRSGLWVRTRTAFDDFVPQQIAEETRERAQVWGQANRTLELVHRQIALAPPEDRDRLLALFNESAAAANGDPMKIIHAGKTVFDQVQGHYDFTSARAEEEAINADQRVAFAENVKTIADTSLMVLGTVATAGAGGTVLYGELTAEAALQTGYGTFCGYLEGGLPEAFKQAATSYSTVAALFSLGMDSYHQGVLDNLYGHAEKPDEIAVDETGAGWRNVGWEVGKEAAKTVAMKFAIEPAAVKLREAFTARPAGLKVSTGGGGVTWPPPPPPTILRPRASRGNGPPLGATSPVNWDEGVSPGSRWPTVEQRLAEADFRARHAEGRAIVNLLKQRCERVEAAQQAGAPREEVTRLRIQAEEAYKLAKSDYHAKSVLKKIADLQTDPKLIDKYNAFDRNYSARLTQEVNRRLAAQGIPPQSLEFISNSASRRGVGMDIDMHSSDPPRFITAPDGRTMPNPEYARWRNGLTQTLPDGTVVRLTPEQFRQRAQAALKDGFESLYGRPSEEVFPTFTTRDHPEAYKDLAWLGVPGTPHAAFACVDPLWTGQAAAVTGFKIDHLGAQAPHLDTYTAMQEGARGLTKDLKTKIFGDTSDRAAFGNETGAEISIHPDSPLAAARPEVQAHFKALFRVLDDFSNNRTGPIEADRQLRALTGGRGLPEVAERMSFLMQAFKRDSLGRPVP